jgi:hypothetical protein
MNFPRGHFSNSSELSGALITNADYPLSPLVKTGLRFLFASLLLFTVAGSSVNAASGSLTNGLIAYYPLNGDGTDLSGNGNDATGFAVAPAEDRFGRSNAALEFDGATSFLKAAVKKLPFGSAPRSISLWGKAQPNPKSASLTEWGAPRDGAAFGVFASEEIYAWALRTFGPSRGIQPHDPVDRPYNWHHVAATYDGTTLTLYRDGRILGRVAEAINTAESLLLIGVGVENTAFFKGSLDDIRIYDRELASTEVLELAGLSSDATWMDSDFDGLSDTAELVVHHTNPAIPDTDRDSFPDGAEIAAGKNPLDASSLPVATFTTHSAIELEFPTRIGATNEIQTSSDLKTWRTLETIDSSTNGIVRRVFPTASKRLFYRIHPPAAGVLSAGSLIGMRLQLSGQAAGEFIDFTSVSGFRGEIGYGKYTYTETGSTGLLHVVFIEPSEWLGDFYDLALSFSSSTSGTFAGNQHYDGTDHAYKGTFGLTLLPELARLNVAKVRSVAQDDPATRLNIFPALEIGFFPEPGMSYLVQNSRDLETWVTVDTIPEAPVGYFVKLYSLRESDRPYYRIELAPVRTDGAPQRLTGQRIRFAFSSVQRESIDFATDSSFVGEIGSGNYTYVPGLPNAAALRVDFTSPASHSGEFYSLSLTFSSRTAGTFTGNRFYADRNHPVSGTFLVSPL